MMKGLKWYILDDTNMMLITSPTIPTSINDNVNIVFAETNVAGLPYTPLYPNRIGNRKVSFSIPIIDRKSKTGNSTIISMFDLLRRPADPLFSNFGETNQFEETPTVIYEWGLHSTPLRWFVRKCDFQIRSDLTNKYGFSQYTVVNMELEVDVKSSLYKMYLITTGVGRLLGQYKSYKQSRNKSGGRPY